MIINLISSPRTISTALMYSFAQRQDTNVVDEPFYAFYLSKTKTPHPGFDEIIESQPNNLDDVLKGIHSIHSEKNVFLKGMAHHLPDDYPFLTEWNNLILIRDPGQIIASFSKVIEQPTLQDVGIKRQWDLFRFLSEGGNQPIVVDSNEILKSPKNGLAAICESLGIPFDSAMLSWKAGPIPEDGVWAKYWYSNVHLSTGFGSYQEKAYPIDPKFDELLTEAKSYFEYLSENRLF